MNPPLTIGFVLPALLLPLTPAQALDAASKTEILKAHKGWRHAVGVPPLCAMQQSCDRAQI